MTSFQRVCRTFSARRAMNILQPKVRMRYMSMERKNLDIIFFVNSFNSLSQRACLELENRGHRVNVSQINKSEDMISFAQQNTHDLIICPFLTTRVPEQIWSNKNIPCLIVHPGIIGDRGMHSLDWTIKNQLNEWGVTVIQAVEEMDCGDIHATTNFKIRRSNINTLTKSSLYANEVVTAAMSSIINAVDNYRKGIKPLPLDYADTNTQGILQPNMMKCDREVNWNDPVEDISRAIRMSDSQPGAFAELRFRKNTGEVVNERYNVYGAHIEMDQSNLPKGAVGDVIGHRDGAILVKCEKGYVWLSHLKKNKLKLPATLWLPDVIQSTPFIPLPSRSYHYGESPNTFQEIWTSTTKSGICFLNFNCYNGAMSTDQCKRLASVLDSIANDQNMKTLVLMGGHNYFSNGIHLNVIEHADDPFKESWENINAINDVVQKIFEMPKLTISALQGNAGAGGCMMALASDHVWCREGVVVNPHYKSMHLFGSEYHTYFLPARVGEKMAEKLTNDTKPILASDALRIGMFDKVMGKTVEEFNQLVHKEAEIVNEISTSKRYALDLSLLTILKEHRQYELGKMKESFADELYHKARRDFVLH